MEKVLNKRFPNKRVVITGAGSGLGRALAVDFAGLGWSVGVNDIDLARAEETLALVEKNGGKGFAMQGDVAKWTDVSALADEAVARFKGADIVINNA
ncbi:MAG TPA: SDR family NAD(P)-dependent oxidoreductase, partial [Desulfosalsimonadaceae bacterium]|nr:SDR family NAD(P)-dependent oxidoreductase [Desulfosalsimonadaceae bacterium]